MDIGCHLPNQGPLANGEALVRFCREAEQRKVASLWVSDHVIFPRSATGSYPGGRFPHPPDKPYLEPVTVAGRRRGLHDPRAPRRLGLHPRPPPPGGDGQDAHQHRRALQRPADLRRRASAGGRRSSRSWACPSTPAAATATRSSARSRRSGPRTTRASTASSSASASWASRPSRCRSRTRRSGWAATARARSAAWSRWATAGTRRPRTRPSSARAWGAWARSRTSTSAT